MVGENVLEVLLASEDCHDGEAINGVVIGKLVDLTRNGEPLVHFASNHSGSPLRAKTTVALSRETLGEEVLLVFEAANVLQPIVIGVVQSPTMPDEKSQRKPRQQFSGPIVECDGERVMLSAEKEIVLRCGEASITLTRAGKILIKGTYVLSRSSGVNRIKGGSVQIN
ncbi:MAG: DUF6484 domain-containing protein [Nitrospirota bacterium]